MSIIRYVRHYRARDRPKIIEDKKLILNCRLTPGKLLFGSTKEIPQDKTTKSQIKNNKRK